MFSNSFVNSNRIIHTMYNLDKVLTPLDRSDNPPIIITNITNKHPYFSKIPKNEGIEEDKACSMRKVQYYVGKGNKILVLLLIVISLGNNNNYYNPHLDIVYKTIIKNIK